VATLLPQSGCKRRPHTAAEWRRRISQSGAQAQIGLQQEPDAIAEENGRRRRLRLSFNWMPSPACAGCRGGSIKLDRCTPALAKQQAHDAEVRPVVPQPAAS
jgi:hypothetical protein